ncbi:MAG: bifunctional 4-hydroxy-2-oxoglutarate aldolase/2-dehydro-3-deoxy-phosphogluconate aldolase [Candidatus Omnitrophica bacterium]|nr:bifunctional 4-hydroxy-2-oxoglutarate aldolase/2-dehydro-3-deoxy-phosphogluconate aldolase [Candidatus Omnitrophota bacterium]
MDINIFKKRPYMGILRGVEPHHIDPLVKAVLNAGLTTVEITMNTDDAPALIEKMRHAAGGRFVVGAGTVLTLSELKDALSAGASFIVSPILISEVVTYCRDHHIPVFPGAFSPQEIVHAWQSGATMVKVFPSKFFGPAYIKEIKGPFKDIERMACGGVNATNVKEFFDAGASAVAFGGSIFQPQWLQNGDFYAIEQALTQIVS